MHIPCVKTLVLRAAKKKTTGKELEIKGKPFIGPCFLFRKLASSGAPAEMNTRISRGHCAGRGIAPIGSSLGSRASSDHFHVGCSQGNFAYPKQDVHPDEDEPLHVFFVFNTSNGKTAERFVSQRWRISFFVACGNSFSHNSTRGRQ